MGSWQLLHRSCWAATVGALPLLCRQLSAVPPNLYDVLGVTPRASSKQIKAAYFRLSKKYHPDRKSGDAVKFQQISAAYEVLGNRHQRRAYDHSRSSVHGHRHGAPRHGPAYHAHHAAAAAAAGRAGQRTGRTAHYDFDAWSQAHYQDVRLRESRARQEYALAAEKRADRREERVRGFVACAAILVLAGYTILMQKDSSAPPPPPNSARPPR